MSNDLSEGNSSNTMPVLERNPWIADTVTQEPEICDDGAMDTNTAENDMVTASQASTLTVPLPSPVSMYENEVPFGPIFRPQIYQDVTDNKAENGVCGLRNLGNTCFMNAGLQCLIGNPQLVQYFMENFYDESTSEMDTSNTPSNRFSEILHKVWSGKFSTLNTSDFKETIALYHPQFKDFRQHDCQEFLALLLDSLHEQLNYEKHKQELALQNEEATSSDPNVKEKEKDDRNNQSANEEEIKESILNNQLVCEKDFTQVPKGIPSENAKENLQFDESDSETSTLHSKSTSLLSFSTDTTIKSHSEDSNQSGSSLQSSDLHQADSTIHRAQSIPEQIQCFSDKTELPLSSDSLQNSSDDHRKIPTVEDICMKDNKILNTNVLVMEYDEGEITVDSEKYHKPDNTNPPIVQEDLEGFLSDTASGMDDLMQYQTEKGASFKPLKETNLLANHRDKYSADTYSKKLFSECQDEEDNDCSINNIKRIKIDEEEKKEKNVRMQQMMKMNTDKDMQMLQVDPYEGRVLEEKNVTVNLLDDQKLKQLSPQASQRVMGISTSDISGMSPSSQLTFNNEAHMWNRYIMQADREWKKYLDHNKSVVVDTFQGQFKSTVVCSDCHHVSVTFEPFMYLSVPLPHAMERQICVIFVPCDNKQPIRYLLTLNKNDKILMLKTALRQLIKEESCDLVIAEVLSNHISRILEENVMLRYVNDDSRTIYAFEMLPAPSISDVVTSSGDIITTGSDISAIRPNNVVSSSSTVSTAPADSTQDNLFTSADVGMTDNLNNSFDNLVSSASEQEVLNNSLCSSSGVSSHTNLEFRTDVHWQTNLLNDPDTTTSSDYLGTNLLDSMPKFDDTVSSTSDLINQETVMPSNSKSDDLITECGDMNTDTGDVTEVKDEVDKWRSCAICLEEMTDSDLMIHTSCGGTLCHTCLDMSFKHYGEAAFICPVCSSAVTPAEDFTQVNLVADYKPKTRILSVPVMQRNEEPDDCGKKQLSLFGHPNLLYVPSELSGEMLYNHVDRVVPVLINYNIVLTDGQGLRCSRCLFTDHCTGCPLSREADNITLQPGDHLTVCFTGLDCVQIDNSSNFLDHDSMEELRTGQSLTLFDCFTAFTKCEVLDEHNPWYCPRCCKNQCAHKTMTVWRYPKTLVVYLKRFVFHELTSTKINNKVMFPLDDLDLSNYVSGPRITNLKYTLQSCVCHFGGVSSGHYTAYAKHPISNKWCYYNDETTEEKEPQGEDYSNAYILFYERQGQNTSINLPKEYMAKEKTQLKVKKVGEKSTEVCQSSSLSHPPEVLHDIEHRDGTPPAHDFYS